MAKRYRLVPAFQTTEAIPELSTEALAYRMNERRHDILDHPSLNNEQKLLLYQAMLDNMNRLIGEDHFKRPLFPPLSSQQSSQLTLKTPGSQQPPTLSPPHLQQQQLISLQEQGVLGIPAKYKALANDVLRFLQQQEQRNRVEIDWDRRVITNPETGDAYGEHAYGELDSIIYKLVTPSVKTTPAEAIRIKQLTHAVSLPGTMLKNESIRRAPASPSFLERTSARRSWKRETQGNEEEAEGSRNAAWGEMQSEKATIRGKQTGKGLWAPRWI